MLNGTSLGKFVVADGKRREINCQCLVVSKSVTFKGLAIQPGENQLSFVIDPEPGYEGMGLRIYSHKNSTDPAIGPEIPITLTITVHDHPQEKEVFHHSRCGVKKENTLPANSAFRRQRVLVRLPLKL